jgi:hypothetical protein
MENKGIECSAALVALAAYLYKRRGVEVMGSRLIHIRMYKKKKKKKKKRRRRRRKQMSRR